jgi:two-component system, chemotaxis family, chemotaxis protein CheY
MAKRVLDVGQCGFDHASISRLIERHFAAKVLGADSVEDALAIMRQGPCDLVLVNRQLDRDGSDGLEIVRQLKADAQLAGTPVMLVSNYPEAQASAIAAGAEPGFGKRDLASDQTRERLAQFLG